MNKRIKKKREKLRVYRVGNRVYTYKGLVTFGKTRVAYHAFELYRKIKNPKLTRPCVKGLINYFYKNRMKYANRKTYDYLRLVMHLNEVNSATATPFACNSCEAMSMEVD